jgi:hypothetical protein
MTNRRGIGCVERAMTTLRLSSVAVSLLMLALAPVLPCAMGGTAEPWKMPSSGVVTSSSHDCCRASTAHDSCPWHTHDSDHPVIGCCCGPTAATLAPTVQYEHEIAVAALPAVHAAVTDLSVDIQFDDVPPLLRPPLVFLSVWRC